MSFVKTYWFALVNVLVFLGVLIFYFVAVSGIQEENDKITEVIEREIRTINALKMKKPSNAWYSAHDKNAERLNVQFSDVVDHFVSSDNLIEKFFSVSSDELVSTVPDKATRPEFKELLAKKWDELIAQYAYDKSGFDNEMTEEEIQEFKKGKLFERSLLSKLEPEWLRNVVTPKQDGQISEAQKRFWIIQELCYILRENNIKDCLKLELGKVYQSEEYKRAGKPYWTIRDLKLSINIEVNKVKVLLKSFFESKLLFRVVGMHQSNKVVLPEGVRSDAIFISFDKPFEVKLGLDLRHYDYYKTDEVVYEEVRQQGSSVNRRNNNSRTRRRR